MNDVVEDNSSRLVGTESDGMSVGQAVLDFDKNGLVRREGQLLGEGSGVAARFVEYP